MGRLLIFVAIFMIASVIAVIKSSIGKISNNQSLKNSTVKGETQKVMDKTAKGLNWMEKQWEEAKKNADQDNNK